MSEVSSRGQALVYFALVLPAVLVPVAGLAVDATALAGRQAVLSGAVETTALTVAAQVDDRAVRAGTGWNADPRAGAAAASVLAAVDGAAVLDGATTSGSSVTVSAHELVPSSALILLPLPPAILRATATARLRHGLATPG